MEKILDRIVRHLHRRFEKTTGPTAHDIARGDAASFSWISLEVNIYMAIASIVISVLAGIIITIIPQYLQNRAPHIAEPQRSTSSIAIARTASRTAAFEQQKLEVHQGTCSQSFVGGIAAGNETVECTAP